MSNDIRGEMPIYQQQQQKYFIELLRVAVAINIERW